VPRDDVGGLRRPQIGDVACSVLAQGRSVFQVSRYSSRWKSPVATAGKPNSAIHPNVCCRLISSQRSTSPATWSRFLQNHRVVLHASSVAATRGSRGEKSGKRAGKKRRTPTFVG
jgi:hypothetical protein